MLPSFDDKGKIFTPVITKKPVAVTIQTSLHRIEGNIHVRPDHRIKDELDNSSSFIAVTDAVIYDMQGNLVLQSAFLAVHIAHIIWLIPTDEI